MFEPIEPNTWRCEIPQPHPLTRWVLGWEVALDPTSCGACGAPDHLHPADLCCDCQHLVRMHGRNTDGCGRIGAGGWCDCPLAYQRPRAEYVNWG